VTADAPARALVKVGFALVVVLTAAQVMVQIIEVLSHDWRAWAVLAAVSIGCYLAVRRSVTPEHGERQGRERVPHEFGTPAERDSTGDRWT
jgi:hypothetical protein